MHRPISGALLSATALAFALGGCSKTGQATAGASSPDSVKQAIKADEAKWNQQFNSMNMEGLLGHYADDADLVVPGLAPAEGSTAIRQIYANAGTDQAFRFRFATDKIDVSKGGDMAYSRGKFTEQYTDPKTSKVMSTSGSYLTVYKKQDDGSWKVVQDWAAADPESTKPVPPEKPAVHAKMTSFG